MVEGLADIIHRQTCPIIDRVLVLRQERLDGRVTIERSEESVAWRHILFHLIDFQRPHALTMHRVPYIGIEAYAPIVRCPVLLPRRDHVEDVGARAVGVAVSRHPHRRIIVVWCLGDIFCLHTRRGVIMIRWVTHIPHRTADYQDGGNHPYLPFHHNRSFVAQIYAFSFKRQNFRLILYGNNVIML